MIMHEEGLHVLELTQFLGICIEPAYQGCKVYQISLVDGCSAVEH